MAGEKNPKDSTTITSIDDAPKAVEIPKTLKVDVTDTGDNLTGDRMDVTINQGEGEAGRQAVYLGINGNGMNIPRGKRVSLPAEAVHVLENAVQTVYESIDGKSVEREVPRFSYIVHGPSK